MRGSDFASEGVNFLYYDFNEISINKGGSYIDSRKWLKKKKKPAINPNNNDCKCFQYAVTLALNLGEINNHPERISKIKPFIEQYNWKDIDFPSTTKDWKKIELNNEIALNILYVPHNTKKIEIAYKSKHNLTREKQVILLMISNGENWHYLTVKNLSGLLRGIIKHHKVRDHCHYTGKYRRAAHNICNLRYKIPKEIPIVFNNGSTYDYHFIIKELVKEFDRNFECLEENTEKYITFSVPIKKKTENKDIEITYKIKFTDSYRFMATSFSKLVDNLTEDFMVINVLIVNQILVI